jgi:Linear amide C-N hydrolases, choloylglycine hydrolase family
MKIHKPHFYLLVSILAIFIPSIAYPCTTFILRTKKGIVFGRNLDWITGTGLILTNPRNLQKIALVDPSERAIKWVSKFGSITFNQVGRDLPYGGMNESGLIVESMTLDETIYPSKDNRYAIGACQWIQFQLDNYSTVEEVINSDTLLRIFDAFSMFHFLVSDRFGHVAAIEFLNGKMVCHTGKSLPVETLANSIYGKSIDCYNKNEDTKSNLSLSNFCTAAHKIEGFRSSGSDSTIKQAFDLLGAVSQGIGTKWSIVYDYTNMRIYFKIFETPTIIGEQKIFLKQPGLADIKYVDFKDFDFSCNKTPKVLDLSCDKPGNTGPFFIEYSTDINRDFISKAFTFFKGWGINIDLKDESVDFLSKYPESFKCVVDN